MDGLRLKSRGSSLLGTTFLIFVLGLSGLSLIEMSTTENIASTNEMLTIQNLYVGQAGLETARLDLDLGNDPSVANRPFGQGSFTITTSPTTSTVFVSSTVGQSIKTQKINAPFGRDCVSLDSTGVYVDGANLRNLRLIKTCNTAAIVGKMIIDWNWPQCSFQEGGTDPYAAYRDPDDPNHIFICHVPSGNPDNEQTNSIAVSSWEGGHSNHEGDYLGPCGGDDTGTDDNESVDAFGNCNDLDHENDHEHENATVQSVGLNGSTIYDAALAIGTPSPLGAEPTQTIDATDYSLTTNSTYTFAGPNGNDIQYSVAIPAHGWYRIVVEFSDATQIDTIFTL